MKRKEKNPVNLFDSTYVVCDVETTGLSPVYNRITEISLIKIQDGEITDKFSTLINPKQHIPKEITYLTGISNEDVIDKPVFDEVAPKIINFFEDLNSEFTVFVGHNVSFDYKFVAESFRRLEEPVKFEVKTLCTCKLARRLLSQLKSKSLGNVSEYLGIKMDRKHRAFDDTLATTKILLHFLEVLQDEYEIETLDEVLTFQNKKIYTEDRKSPALKRVNIKLKDIPANPGVYFFKSASGEILYIGKAKNLRERLSSYFRHNSELTYKIKRLLSSIRGLEFEITDSELSALILESKLIKRHKPRFNTAIKRFRFHPFLKIDVQNDFPKVDKVYELENDGANYYGPFSSRRTVNQLLREIKDNFKIRKCEQKKIKASKSNSNCMYYDIGQCDAPCNLTVSKDEYRKEIIKAHDYITETKKDSSRTIYKNLMNVLAEKMDFEKAASLRDRLKDIEKVMSFQKVITSAINNKKIIIKCDTTGRREVFFIHNGKLMNTYTLEKNSDFDQRNIMGEITETTEYLYFSLSKFIKHKYSAEELDEIKVISNWLALNRDRNSYLEINDSHTKEELVKFIFK
ncbi:MAG: GIY-YIG nuclease family protein [Ignavibacteriae bacterium]|nr:GIY-YIG nuclease family protein [Ignavibacteriota bacterium]